MPGAPPLDFQGWDPRKPHWSLYFVSSNPGTRHPLYMRNLLNSQRARGVLIEESRELRVLQIFSRRITPRAAPFEKITKTSMASVEGIISQDPNTSTFLVCCPIMMERVIAATKSFISESET